MLKRLLTISAMKNVIDNNCYINNNNPFSTHQLIKNTMVKNISSWQV